MLYSGFSVGPESSKYLLSLGAKTNGSLDDLSIYQNGWVFATYDNDTTFNCGRIFLGGWWFVECYSFCLTCNTASGNYYNLASSSYFDYDRIQMTIQP